MVDFALDSDPPQLHCRSCGGGFWGWGLHQAIHAGRPKGPAYWCSPAQWTTLKGWGGGSSCMCKASVFDSALWTPCGAGGGGGGVTSLSRASRFAAALQPRELRRTNPAPVR